MVPKGQPPQGSRGPKWKAVEVLMGVQRRDQGHQEPGLQARSEGKASQAASKDGWISVTNWCPTLCDPMDCSPQGSSVHGILQARTLEWAATSFSSASTLLQMALFHSFLWLSDIPLYLCTTFSLSIHLSVDD